MTSVYMRTPRNVRSVYARPRSDQTEKTIEPADDGQDKSACQNGTELNQKSSRLKNSRKCTKVDGVDPNQGTECSTDIGYRSLGQKQSSNEENSASGRLVKERSSVSRKSKRGKAGGLVSKSASSKASSEPSKPSKAEGSEPASTTKNNHKEAASVSSKKSRTAEVGESVTTTESGDKKKASVSSKSNEDERGEPTAALEGHASKAPSSTSDPLKENTGASEEGAKLRPDGGDKSITRLKPYVCGTCQKRYTTETHLREHERIHLKQKTAGDDDDVQFSERTEHGPPFQCDVCHKVYGSQSRLRKHRTIHSQEKNLMCEACGKSFSNSGTLKLHMLEHTGERPFVCDVCNKTYRRNFDLQQHKRLHTGERPYVCNVCGKAFTKMDYLKTHMQCHNGVRPFKCDECSQSFRRTDQLKVHKRTHTGVKLFECEICKKAFSTKNVLKKHMRSRVHEIKKAPVSQTRCKICEICGVQLGKNKSMKAHMMTHTGERPFVCEVCSKGFIIKYDWLVHKRTHTGERPFVCSICSASYPRNADLSQHIRIVHWGRRPYICDVCNEAFARHQQLKKHKVTHTNTVPHTCSQCGKGFMEAAALKSHMRTHTGEKPFACTHCSRSFSDAGSRKRHMRIHTGEKPYKCAQCSAVFARAEPYKQHRESVHGTGLTVVTQASATDQSVVLPAQASSLSLVVSSEEGFQDIASQPSGSTSVFVVNPAEAFDSTASERVSVFNASSLMVVPPEEMDEDTDSSVAGNIPLGGTVVTESVENLHDSVPSGAAQGLVKEDCIYTLGTNVTCQPLPPSYSYSQSSEVMECSVGDPPHNTLTQLTHEEHEALGSAVAEPQVEDGEMVPRIIEVQVTHGRKGMPPKVIEVIYDSSVSQGLPSVGLETVIYNGTVEQDPSAAESETEHEGGFPSSPTEEVEVETVKNEDIMAMQVEYAENEKMVEYGGNEEVKVVHAGNEAGLTVTESHAVCHGAESLTKSPAGSQDAESVTYGAESAVNLTIEKSQCYSAASEKALCLAVTGSQDSSHDVRNTTGLTGIEAQVDSQDADNTITLSTAVAGIESQTDCHPPLKYFQVYHADGTESLTIIESHTAFDNDPSNSVLEQVAVGHVEDASSPTMIEVQEVETIQIITVDPTTSVSATNNSDTAIQNSLLESIHLEQKYLPPVVVNTDTDKQSNENGKPMAVSMDASLFGDIMKTQKRTFGKAKRNWICEICGNSFTHSASLKKHMTVQHKACGDQAFVCDVCSRVCISKSELESHARKHTGERPFACELCSNTYKHKSDLRQHILTIHMGEKPHVCDLCHKTFTSGRGLKEHKLIHQGVKPHKCSTCGKAFTQLSTLTTHVQGTHSGLRPWVCQYCGKDFSDQSSLARHQRLHTGEKPYRCEHCPCAFARSEQLKKHLSKEHPGDLQNLATLAEAVATIR